VKEIFVNGKGVYGLNKNEVHFGLVMCPIVNNLDIEAADGHPQARGTRYILPPFYDNPCCVAVYPFCEASTCCGPDEDSSELFSVLRGFACLPCTTVMFSLIGFIWCLMWPCTCCLSETQKLKDPQGCLPCSVQPVTPLYAKNYPSVLVAGPRVENQKGYQTEATSDTEVELSARSGTDVVSNPVGARMMREEEPRAVSHLTNIAQSYAAETATVIGAAVPEAAPIPLAQQLRELKSLFDEDLISQDDYNAKKKNCSASSKGGLRRKNTPEKQKTATKPQGQESKGRLAFEEMKKRT
jgi:hypothetical protein